jgi:prepilin-type N-terminal cleavage/methylation domain-containing protein
MKATMNIKFDRAKSDQAGMTLIELLIAMVVLAVGLSGIMSLIVAALATNGRNRTDTSSTLASQMVIEQMANVPASSNAVFTLTDCAGVQWNVNTADPSGTTAGTGAPFRAVNDSLGVAFDLDFNVAYGAAAPGNGYSMLWTSCGINASQQVVYDVRWHVVKNPDGFSKTVTVAARRRGASNSLVNFAIPVQLKTILGN